MKRPRAIAFFEATRRSFSNSRAEYAFDESFLFCRPGPFSSLSLTSSTSSVVEVPKNVSQQTSSDSANIGVCKASMQKKQRRFAAEGCRIAHHTCRFSWVVRFRWSRGSICGSGNSGKSTAGVLREEGNLVDVSHRRHDDDVIAMLLPVLRIRAGIEDETPATWSIGSVFDVFESLDFADDFAAVAVVRKMLKARAGVGRRFTAKFSCKSAVAASAIREGRGVADPGGVCATCSAPKCNGTSTCSRWNHIDLVGLLKAWDRGMASGHGWCRLTAERCVVVDGSDGQRLPRVYLAEAKPSGDGPHIDLNWAVFGCSQSSL
eukprot:6206279-Pleurochrysis_carterae.AAC.5